MFNHNRKRAMVLLSLLAVFAAGLPQLRVARASHTPAPASVTVAGSLQSELGCPGDWQPECAAAHLVYDAADDVWQQTFSLSPAGAYEYKAALNDNWTENYGLGATPGGANIPLNLAAAGPVKFYYDHKSHWITENKSSVIAVAPGSFQSELGCPGDWQPDCLRSWLQDVDGDGIYSFTTSALPAGTYEGKVAINESWDENYGAGGVPGGPNIAFVVPTDNAQIGFFYDAATHILTIGTPQRGSLALAQAHWVAADTIAWSVEGGAALTYTLHYDPDGALALTPEGITGGSSLPLTYDPAGLSDEIRAQFPHLASYGALRIGTDDLELVHEILKGQIAVSATDAAGNLVDATGLQIPGVLDDLYANDAALGVTYAGTRPTLRVWAPTARSVRLHLFNSANPNAAASTIVPMTVDPATGVWSATGTSTWTGKFYLYEVEVYVHSTGQVEHNLVTDPYSISLSMNSRRSQIVNLGAASLKPAGWDSLAKPPLDAPEDIVLYELHVRDFSASDQSVPAAQRGTFMAFTSQTSNGMRHLRALANAGLTHIHLLPANDCASINENKAQWQSPDPALLATYPPNSEEQQRAVVATREQDAFNWCYDPFHYTTPEGSYSTNPDGPQRILEFRAMVQALARSGLRVVMDVVYNHTPQSGQAERSVLDKVVPGYYHRLNPLSGQVETSTCCQNTATEHRMMEKLMIDSLVTWATAYKVDGFRFDLMGHHMRSNIEKARDRLRALTPAADGVDGSKIYLYGEGWNFGEVADNARGVHATQINMAGSGVGTFNDRLRDGVRGGGPFDNVPAIVLNQGFINGLYYDPNASNQGDADELATLKRNQDWIRVGMAGNLRDYAFVDRLGNPVTGAQVDYNGQPTGYTLDPQEVITYVEAHDNQTLFDIIQYKTPLDTPMADRVRIQNLGNDIVMLGQGVPFFHAGQDMLRSKSLDRNSYNSGDWFNRLDFTYRTNNWGVGLPPMEGESPAERAIMAELLGNPALKPSRADILLAVEHFQKILRIRKSSPLFRLRTAADVQARVAYLNTGPDQVPGLIVMRISDTTGADLDPRVEEIVVLFNANDQPADFAVPGLAGKRFNLHPFQMFSRDPALRAAGYDRATGTFSVPARTTAVFLMR